LLEWGAGVDDMAEPATRLKVSDDRGVSVIEFSDRKILDELCIHEIQEELSGLVDTKSSGNLLLCFKNVEHLSSAALGMLITLKKKVEEKQGKLKLSDINPQIYEVFKITRLNKIFDIHPSIDKARASF
jgi:anti-sigma B factor antagonist